MRGWSPATCSPRIRDLQAIVSADEGIDYGDVMHLVDVVKSLGVTKFALSTEGKR